jgi:hypothetical protein
MLGCAYNINGKSAHPDKQTFQLVSDTQESHDLKTAETHGIEAGVCARFIRRMSRRVVVVVMVVSDRLLLLCHRGRFFGQPEYNNPTSFPLQAYKDNRLLLPCHCGRFFGQPEYNNPTSFPLQAYKGNCLLLPCHCGRFFGQPEYNNPTSFRLPPTSLQRRSFVVILSSWK